MLKKYPIAILFMLASIVCAFFLGQIRAPHTGPYDAWISDDANLFSTATEREISRCNIHLDDTYNSVVAVATVDTLEGQEDYASKLRRKLSLSDNDCLLLIVADTRRWSLTCGGEMGEMGITLNEKFQEYLGNRFSSDDLNQEIRTVFRELDDWYDSSLPFNFQTLLWRIGHFLAIPLLILFILLNLFWIVPVIIVVLTILDNNRYTQYITRWPDVESALESFRPILPWHKPGSIWYQKRQKKTTINTEPHESKN